MSIHGVFLFGSLVAVMSALCALTLPWQQAVFHNNAESVKFRGRDRGDSERAQQIKTERRRGSVREGGR